MFLLFFFMDRAAILVMNHIFFILSDLLGDLYEI